MSEQAERSRGWFYLAVVLALLPLLYVLSSGPSLYFVVRSGGDVPAVEVVYSPVAWLYGHTPLRGPLERYLNFWERLAAPEEPPVVLPVPVPGVAPPPLPAPPAP
jgi:hypothetical protein